MSVAPADIPADAVSPTDAANPDDAVISADAVIPADAVISEAACPADAKLRFEALYRNTYDDVFYFVLRRIGTSQAAGQASATDYRSRAEEVVHETYLTAWRKITALPTDAAQARAWLFATARNQMLNEKRGASRRAALVIKTTDDAVLTRLAESQAPDEQAIQRLTANAAWARLSATDQEAIALAAFEGLTAAEAARVLGISVAAVKFRLHFARNKLRRALAELSEIDAQQRPPNTAPKVQSARLGATPKSAVKEYQTTQTQYEPISA